MSFLYNLYTTVLCHCTFRSYFPGFVQGTSIPTHLCQTQGMFYCSCPPLPSFHPLSHPSSPSLAVSIPPPSAHNRPQVWLLLQLLWTLQLDSKYVPTTCPVHTPLLAPSVPPSVAPSLHLFISPSLLNPQLNSLMMQIPMSQLTWNCLTNGYGTL